MSGLDPARILAAAREWTWVPPDAVDVPTDDYRLTIYPGWAASVQWSSTERPVADVVASVLARADEAGSPLVRWWVGEHTRPSTTPDELRRRGFRPAEEVDVLALDLADAEALAASLAVPEDVQVALAASAEDIRDGAMLGSRVFGDYEPTAAQLAQELDQLALPLDGTRAVARRYLARLGSGAPAAGTGGLTLVGDLGRLWGGAVEPRARGRGVYRGLLAARCRDLAAHGADVALVKARVDTSSPVLQRVGFRRFGAETAWELRR